MPTLNERIASLDVVIENCRRARKIAMTYRDAKAGILQLGYSLDDPDLEIPQTAEIQATLLARAQPLIDEAKIELAKV